MTIMTVFTRVIIYVALFLLNLLDFLLYHVLRFLLMDSSVVPTDLQNRFVSFDELSVAYDSSLYHQHDQITNATAVNDNNNNNNINEHDDDISSNSGDRSNRYRKGSGSLLKNENETFPRRTALLPDRFIERTHADVSTMNQLFERVTKDYVNRPCLGKRDVIRYYHIRRGNRDLLLPELTDVRYLNYGEVRSRVHNFAAGMVVYTGLNSTDFFGIFEETKMEWLICLQACFRYNLTAVTIYASLGDDALISAINETRLAAMLVNESNLANFQSNILCHCPSLKYLIYCREFHESLKQDHDLAATIESIKNKYAINVISFDEVEEFGENLGVSKPAVRNEANEDSLALVIYTSGTMNAPKGVMLSHKNLLAATAAVDRGVRSYTYGMKMADTYENTYCAYLPLAHILELITEHVILVRGGCIAYARPRTLFDTAVKPSCDLRAVCPTLMAGVPRVFDAVRKNMIERIQSYPSVVRFFFNAAYHVKLNAIYNGRDTPLWNFLVFRHFKKFVGGKMICFVSGGAPLSKETHEFMRVCFSCSVIQGYGLTETSAGATVQSLYHPFQTNVVGVPIPCCEIKLVSDPDMGYFVNSRQPKGEILIRGPSVARGYYKQEKMTKEFFLSDGWFCTGDIGQLNQNGTFSIVGRKKNLVKLANGEYISLERLEAIYANSQFIAPNGICVYCDSYKDFPVAIVLPQQTYLRAWAHQNNIHFDDLAELCTEKTVIKAILKDLQIQARRSKLQRFEEIKDIRLFLDEWTEENGMVTATQKLKRMKIVEHYQQAIDEMYRDER
jgi:long-chain acyl-CoA synthetase